MAEALLNGGVPMRATKCAARVSAARGVEDRFFFLHDQSELREHVGQHVIAQAAHPARPDGDRDMGVAEVIAGARQA